MSEKHHKRLAGVALVSMIAGLVWLTGGFYTHAFSDPLTLTVHTPRSGLVMDPGNKVKFRGVEIGRVDEVRRAGDGVELVLALDRDHARDLPANLDARILATTAFGTKYVDLYVRSGKRVGQLQDNAVVVAHGVTREINTLFKSLDDVLTSIDVVDLNETLSVLAASLDGRGQQIADLAAAADAYLIQLEPQLPQLREDLIEAAKVARLGVRVSSDVIALLENATVTGQTLVSQERVLSRLLVDLTVLGRTGTRVLGLTAYSIAALARRLLPTTDLLAAYSAELPCLLKGLAHTRRVAARAIGGDSPGLRVTAPLRTPVPPYRYPGSLPGLPRGGGPDCAGLPIVPTSKIPVPEVGGPR